MTDTIDPRATPADDPGSRPRATDLSNYPPFDRWDDWEELDAQAWPDRVPRRYSLIPTTCFNCEANCGLLAYVDQDTGEIARFEGNPEHPASRGRNWSG